MHCPSCPNKRRRKALAPEPATGTLKAIIVGEAPSAADLEAGRPLVGASGRYLGRRLPLVRSDCHVTHAIMCDVDGLSGREVADCRIACSSRLDREIAGLDADVLALGATALHSTAHLRRRPAILDWRGQVVDRADAARLIFPTLHPAFVLREPAWEPVFARDLARFVRLSAVEWSRPEAHAAQLILPRTVRELKACLAELGPVVGFDIETNGASSSTARLTVIGLSDGERVLGIPWSTTPDGMGAWFNGHSRQAAAAITEALRTRVAVTHNGPAFDHIIAARFGIHISRWEDTLLAHHAIAAHMPQRLGHVVSMYLDVPAWKQEHRAHELATMSEIRSYNAQDVLYTARTWQAMQADLEPERRVYEFAKQTANLCREMHENGFFVDQARAATVRKELLELEHRLKREMRRVTRNQAFDPLSVTALRHTFFKQLHAPVFFRSERTGAPALDKTVLRAFTGLQGPIGELATALHTYRGARKLRSTYLDNLPVDSDGRVRPAWRSYGTVGDRLSCRGPNLANLPRKGKVADIRQIYAASPGNVLVAFDFKQIEFRVAAYWSGDPEMIAACESADIHAANAAVLFGATFETADPLPRKLMRDVAKSANFAVCYMASAHTVWQRIIAEGFELTLAQVEGMLAMMRKRFRRYYSHQEAELRKCMERGYVEAPITGRKRWLGHNPKPAEAANFPIQSGAAAIALSKIFEICARRTPGARAVAQVYDQIIFEAPAREADELSAICQELAEAPLELGGRQVSFPVDLQRGERWSEL